MPKPNLFILPKEQSQRRTVPNNLPVQVRPLIGRESETDAVRRLLEEPEVRLLTLVGPGGVGKSRLAVQVAGEMLAEFEDGVYFVELAPVTDPHLIVPTIASTLQVQEVSNTPLVDTLRDYLRGKRILLVLDNFEQVVSASQFVAELLASCPDLKVLVTSRSALKLRAEREFPLLPLTIPEPSLLARKQPPSAVKLAEYGAVALFAQRASEARSDFRLSENNARAVVEVCRRVDGLPLAIELVAAHAKLLSPQSILARLTHPLQLLTDGAPETPARHQTMHDTIDWSYRLLGEREQRLFRRLSVFVGGFALQAAEAVCNERDEVSIGSDHPEAIEVLKGVEALVDKSLVRQVERRDEGRDEGEDLRLTMLETVREYAWEQLEASGEAETMRRRHADYFLWLAKEAAPHLEGADIKAWLDRLNPDQANLRAALGWLLDQEEASASQDAQQLLISLFVFWDHRSHASEVRRWFEESLAHPGAQPDPRRAGALRLSSYMAARQSDLTVARAWAERAVEESEALGDKLEITRSLNSLAGIALMQGDYASSRSLWEACLAGYRELGDDSRIVSTLNNLGEVARYQGDHNLAESLFRESLDGFRRLGKKMGVLATLESLGYSLYKIGRFREAEGILLEGLEFAHGIGSRLHVAVFLSSLSAGALAEMDQVDTQTLRGVERVARYFGIVAELLESIGKQLEPLEQAEFERNVASTRERLGEEVFTAAWEEGQALTIDEAVALATQEFGHEDESSKPKGRGRPRKQTAGGLTDREYEVAILVAQGLSNRVIAEQLVLSKRTVEMHVAHALDKLGLTTRTELAAWAIHHSITGETPRG